MRTYIPQKEIVSDLRIDYKAMRLLWKTIGHNNIREIILLNLPNNTAIQIVYMILVLIFDRSLG